ncbi:MAG: hypothetical protein BMS9Abin26_0289 [Gammaproteobacteria bacterium]|nr:MAG: hypothetical protein BMS9Abin26_0289 [Gammaproteobacteria bacterium]
MAILIVPSLASPLDMPALFRKFRKIFTTYQVAGLQRSSIISSPRKVKNKVKNLSIDPRCYQATALLIPAASRSISALSVFSQVKFSSSRPKCP